MNYIFLTSTEFVRNMTNISSNTQDKFLQSALREAQEMELQQVLGTNLLRKLQSMVADGSIKSEENVKYDNLVKEFQYFLAYSTITNLIPILSVKLDNIGSSMTSDERVQSLTIKEMFQMKDHYQNKSDFYKERLQKYLVERHNDYPELDSCKIDEMHHNLYSSASTSIWLGGVRGKRKSY